jgi:hypothetical protein
MTISAEALKNFIDGKLAAEEAEGIQAQVARDPELAAYVEDQKALQSARASPLATRLRRLHEIIATGGANWVPVAILAIGIGLGVLLAGTFGIATDFRSQDGALIAQGALAHDLSMALADNETDVRGAVRVAASFWSKNGSFCRAFLTPGNGQTALAGIACRERGAWRVAIMETMAPLDAPQLTLGALPASVRGVMDNLIVGQPLNANAERQARSQDWRVR